MKEKPYFSSVSWLPIISETRIAASRLKTRNAKERVSHSNAVSIHGAERRGRVLWGSLITGAASVAFEPFSVAVDMRSSSPWIVGVPAVSGGKKRGGAGRLLSDQ